MSLDTKYRPLRYGDVLGQDATIAVCKQIVKGGTSFHQSYVFAGAHGGGKTTTARILARAMLCANPKDGEPCDECHSCVSVLNDESENFIEVDAATNSGKDDVRRITEEAQFGSFSGKRKVYLFDECFTRATQLMTPEGSRSIKDLVEQKYDGLVLSFDMETGEQCWKPVTNWYDIEDERECLTLEFDNGVFLSVTTNQEMATKNRGWVLASELTKDDDIYEIAIRDEWYAIALGEPATTRIVRSYPIGEQKVYDVTVADTHSFFAYSHVGAIDHAILAHNCHELSKSAMDAMLKPLEDNIRGTQEKQLICIFCTTEPNKMRPAIMSRCAPAFKIRINSPEEIAKRLEFICTSEGIDVDVPVLSVIAEVCECHIRDAIKAVEGVSMLGQVNRENVERYLHMDANVLYLDLLESLGTDLPRALETIEKLHERVSPATSYGRMADISMMAYRLSYVGTASVPSFWDRDRLKKVGDLHKEFLVEFAQSFAERPAHPTNSMLMCDVSALHQKRAGIRVVASAVTEVTVPATDHMVRTAPVTAPEAFPEPEPSPTPLTELLPVESSPAVDGPPPTSAESPAPTPNPSLENAPIESLPKTGAEKALEPKKEAAQEGSIQKDPFVNEVGVHINPQAQQMSRGQSPRQAHGAFGMMSITSFTQVLQRRVIELTEEKSISGRSARRDNLGST